MEQDTTKNPRGAKKSNINWTEIGVQVGMTALNAVIFAGVSSVTARAFSGPSVGGSRGKLADGDAHVVPLRKVV